MSVMDKRTQNGRHNGGLKSPNSAADRLLGALAIDAGACDRTTSAALRALAEEVLWLREEQSRLEQALAEAETLADHDALCPVYNRRAFERELTREIALAARHDTPLCVFYIDLDNFKMVNDRFGHAAGDEALRQVCDIILSHVRQTDIVGRLGGDEFGVILTHAELADSQMKAERLTRRIDRIVIDAADGPAGEAVRLGASCGVLPWSGQLSAELLISEADEAMFRAKSARKRGSD